MIELKQIRKDYGERTVIKNQSLSIKDKEFFVLIGPSGSGKSTLVNILSLMDEPTAGTYTLGGDDASRLSDEETLKFRREKIGLIFQQFHLIPYLNCVENVMIAQYYHSSVDEEDAKKALERVGLGHRLDHRPSQLSGGEQQRLCIARALINDPDILIADEPTGNLDEANERVVLELFQKLRSEGKTILLITHNPDLGQFGDKIVYLRHGKMENIHYVSDGERADACEKMAVWSNNESASATV